MKNIIFSVVTLVVLVAFGLNCAPTATEYYSRAAKHVDSGNYQQAIEEATLALKDLEDLTGRPEDGVIKGHPSFAAEYGEKRAMIYELRAKAHDKLRNYNETTLDYEKAALIYTETIRLLDSLSRDYYNYDVAVQVPSRIARLYNNRAWIYTEYLKRDFNRAIEDATKAIELLSECAACYNTRGWAYLGNSDYSHAIDDFYKALQLDPKLESSQKGLEKVQELQATTPPSSALDLDDF